MRFDNFSLASVDMYLDYFQLRRSPFLDESDPQIFFPGAGREEILQALRQDLAEDKPLLKVIGGEGCGKTFMCKQLAITLPDQYQLVFITNPVGSFEDLLRIICRDLGLTAEAESKSEELVLHFREYLTQLQEENRVVFIIIDEAEKLFLATLERLIRIICELGKNDLLHILLAGRPGLEDNIEQLSDYSIKVDINTAYALKPLTLEETGKYLHFRLRQVSTAYEQTDDIFTEEAVRAIFELARGNLRTINALAEEALQNACLEESEIVLPEYVGSRDTLSGRGATRKVEARGEPVNSNKIWLGLGIALFIVLLISYFNTTSDGPQPDPASNPPVSEPVAAGPSGGDELPEQPVVETQPGPGAEAVAPPMTAGPEEVPPPGDEVQSLDSTAAAPPQPDLPASRATSRPAAEVTPPPTPSAAPLASSPRDGSALYAERLAAGKRWLKESSPSNYTIQLMVLGSKDAEENLKKNLTRDEYYSVKDELAVLKKKGAPPIIFVFYGTFMSMDEARQARNTMPVFLRQHHPYALSVRDAVKKAQE